MNQSVDDVQRMADYIAGRTDAFPFGALGRLRSQECQSRYGDGEWRCLVERAYAFVSERIRCREFSA